MDIECPLRVQGWRDGKPIESPDRSQLRQLVEDPHVLLWIDLVDPSVADLHELTQRVRLSPDALEDATAPFERPKLTRHENHLFLMAYATDLNGRNTSAREGRLQLHRVSLFILQRMLITIRRGDGFDMDAVEKVWDTSEDISQGGVYALVHGVLDAIVDSQFETIQAMDDDLEDLEEQLFAQQRTSRDFLGQVYGHRKDLVRLRRVITPMREVVGGLMRHERQMPRDLGAWYEDLYDHSLRAAEWTESLRDMVESIFETNLSLQDLNLNTVMKKLAGWAAVIAVPTAITGWFGQNVPYWGFAKPVGVWMSTASILLVSLGLYAFLRHRDWI